VEKWVLKTGANRKKGFAAVFKTHYFIPAKWKKWAAPFFYLTRVFFNRNRGQIDFSNKIFLFAAVFRAYFPYRNRGQIGKNALRLFLGPIF